MLSDPSFNTLSFFLEQEWEERLTASQEVVDQFKKKYIKEKHGASTGEGYMEHARSLSSKWSNDRHGVDDEINMNMTFDTAGSRSRTAESVVSIGSGLAQSARQIVGSFNCTGLNDRSGPVVASAALEDLSYTRPSPFSSSRESRPPQPTRTSSKRSSPLRRGRSNTRRDYPNGPQ